MAGAGVIMVVVPAVVRVPVSVAAIIARAIADAEANPGAAAVIRTAVAVAAIIGAAVAVAAVIGIAIAETEAEPVIGTTAEHNRTSGNEGNIGNTHDTPADKDSAVKR